MKGGDIEDTLLNRLALAVGAYGISDDMTFRECWEGAKEQLPDRADSSPSRGKIAGGEHD